MNAEKLLKNNFIKIWFFEYFKVHSEIREAQIVCGRTVDERIAHLQRVIQIKYFLILFFFIKKFIWYYQGYQWFISYISAKYFSILCITILRLRKCFYIEIKADHFSIIFWMKCLNLLRKMNQRFVVLLLNLLKKLGLVFNQIFFFENISCNLCRTNTGNIN